MKDYWLDMLRVNGYDVGMETKLILFNIQKFSLHDGPGIRTAVFFSGCPLRCKWCSNPESQQMGYRSSDASVPSAYTTTIRKAMSEVCRDKAFYEKSGGGLTLTGGEVLMQAKGAMEFLRAAFEEGIHRCVETCCFAPKHIFQKLIEQVDLLLPDLKHHDSRQHHLGTGADLKPILDNLCILKASGVPHRLRIPVIPGYNDSIRDAHAFGILIESLGIQSVDLLPFHPYGERKYELMGLDYPYKGVPISRDEKIMPFREALLEHIPDVKIGG